MPSAVATAPALTEYALDRAMESVLVSKAGFPAFVITETAGERTLHEFATERPGQSAAAARYFLRGIRGIDSAVLVWDGYVMNLDKRVDAVMAEHTVAGSDVSTIAARRYRPARLFRPVVPLGVTMFVGEGHPLF